MPNVSLEFTTVLNEWAEVFTRRSMAEMLRFSRRSGLSIAQLHTLLRLHHRGACGVSEIGDHLGVTNAASSQLVDRLVEQGLLRRSEAAHDRRFKQVELTEAGQAVIEASATLRRRWMEALTEILQPEEQQAVIHALTSLTMAAQRLEPLPLEEEILIQKE